MVDAGLALFDELADTVCLDFLLRFEAFFLFYFNLDPQTLAVVAILKPLAVTLHVPEAEEEVFVSSSPRMVDAHQVVSSNRAVDEGVVFLGIVVARQVTIDESSTVCIGRVPTLEPLLFSRDEVDFGFGQDRVESILVCRHWARVILEGFSTFKFKLTSLEHVQFRVTIKSSHDYGRGISNCFGRALRSSDVRVGCWRHATSI